MPIWSTSFEAIRHTVQSSLNTIVHLAARRRRDVEAEDLLPQLRRVGEQLDLLLAEDHHEPLEQAALHRERGRRRASARGAAAARGA